MDASGLAMAGEPIDLPTSEHAAIEMSDTPSRAGDNPTATQVISMCQTNCRCVLSEREFSAKVLRSNAVATLTGALWANLGHSRLMDSDERQNRAAQAAPFHTEAESWGQKRAHQIGQPIRGPAGSWSPEPPSS